MRVRPLLLTAAAAAVCLPLSGCAHASPDTGPGPAEVSVTKTAAAPVEGGQDDLGRLDVATVPGSANVEWGTVSADVWLPQPSSVIAGLGDSSPARGSIYLSVPSSYATTRDALAANQVEGRDSMTVTEVDDPRGAVLSLTSGGKDYVISVSPDPDSRPGFSVVMVQWSPTPEAG